MFCVARGSCSATCFSHCLVVLHTVCVFISCVLSCYVLSCLSWLLSCFRVPCALMSIVLTLPILFPDYWFSCPACCPSLPSSFAPYLFSLCLKSCASSFLYQPWLCPALPCPVQPCQDLLPACFTLQGSFVLFYFIINKA